MGPGVQFNGAAPGPPSFFNPLFDEAREPPSESAQKESKRLRFQTFAQSEYAEFDETLVWCALGSATGGNVVSAISHSRVHPVENHKRSNCDRSLKESVPSRL